MKRRPQLAGTTARRIAALEGCYCGCRQPVTGKALYASPTCRKRVQRMQDRQERLRRREIPLEERMFNDRYYTNRD